MDSLVALFERKVWWLVYCLSLLIAAVATFVDSKLFALIALATNLTFLFFFLRVSQALLTTQRFRQRHNRSIQDNTAVTTATSAAAHTPTSPRSALLYSAPPGMKRPAAAPAPMPPPLPLATVAWLEEKSQTELFIEKLAKAELIIVGLSALTLVPVILLWLVEGDAAKVLALIVFIATLLFMLWLFPRASSAAIGVTAGVAATTVGYTQVQQTQQLAQSTQQPSAGTGLDGSFDEVVKAFRDAATKLSDNDFAQNLSDGFEEALQQAERKDDADGVIGALTDDTTVGPPDKA